MAISKRIYGVQGFKSQKMTIEMQAKKLSDDIRFLFYNTWLNDKQVKDILAKGSEPMRNELQQQYLAADPTGMQGSVANYIIIKNKGKKRFGTIYIGPDTKISRGWRVWWLLNWGFLHVSKNGTTTHVVGKRFIERAFDLSYRPTLEAIKDEFNVRLKNYAKKLGYRIE